VQETSREPDLDLKSWRNVQDPFPLYAWLRDHDPVHWSESLSAWAVTRYQDVTEVFDRPETFSSDRFRKIDERYASQRPAVRAVVVLGGFGWTALWPALAAAGRPPDRPRPAPARPSSPRASWS